MTDQVWEFKSYNRNLSNTELTLNYCRADSSTFKSSTARPLAGNFVRTKTDLGFSGPVLKYERFDPPPVNLITNMNDYDSSEQNVHSSNFKPNDQTHFENRDRNLSPNHEKPNPLDLDLMSDLQHIINRKPSPLKSATQLIENDSWASLDRGRGNTLQSEEETINDLILLNNGDMRNQSKLHENNVDCVIFDPLLQPALNADESESRDMLRKNLPSGLPRPPSKSSIQHIARNHNIQQQSIDQLQE